MNHLDLFSGIGGFALAVDKVWPNSTHTFCDNDLFCQSVLRKHWPNSKIYGDIRTITDTSSNGLYAEHNSTREVNPDRKYNPQEDTIGRCGIEFSPANSVDLLTGGFPCQPFSQAGRRRGEEDDRFLWPEMLRVIREFSPLWVIAENVRGLLTQGGGVVFERVCTDLEAAGYEVQPIIIPAVAVGAPHRRDRVWFVGHAKESGRGEGNRQGIGTERWEVGERGQTRDEVRSHIGADGERYAWSANWLEVATRLCGVFNGLSKRLDRNPRLKALGNAIVPQVAEEIMRAISGVK